MEITRTVPLHSRLHDLRIKHHFRLRRLDFQRDRPHRKLDTVAPRACFRRDLPADHRWEAFNNQDHRNHLWGLGRPPFSALLVWAHHLECHPGCLLDFLHSLTANKLMEGDNLLVRGKLLIEWRSWTSTDTSIMMKIVHSVQKAKNYITFPRFLKSNPNYKARNRSLEKWPESSTGRGSVSQPKIIARGMRGLFPKRLSVAQLTKISAPSRARQLQRCASGGKDLRRHGQLPTIAVRGSRVNYSIE